MCGKVVKQKLFFYDFFCCAEKSGETEVFFAWIFLSARKSGELKVFFL